jgi:single-strand DNA-binding protein
MHAKCKFAPYIRYQRQSYAGCVRCIRFAWLSMTGGHVPPDLPLWGHFMNNLNSILIEGNMVRDPQYRTTTKGTPVCHFSLASNRYLRRENGYEEEVAYFDVETWAKLADQCNNMGRKGRGVRVVGRLKQDRWTDNDGKLRSRVSIVAEHVEFRPDFKKEASHDNGSAEKGKDSVYSDSLANEATEAAEAVQDYDNAAVTEYEESPVLAETVF